MVVERLRVCEISAEKYPMGGSERGREKQNVPERRDEET